VLAAGRGRRPLGGSHNFWNRRSVAPVLSLLLRSTRSSLSLAPPPPSLRDDQPSSRRSGLALLQQLLTPGRLRFRRARDNRSKWTPCLSIRKTQMGTLRRFLKQNQSSNHRRKMGTKHRAPLRMVKPCATSETCRRSRCVGRTQAHARQTADGQHHSRVEERWANVLETSHMRAYLYTSNAASAIDEDLFIRLRRGEQRRKQAPSFFIGVAQHSFSSGKKIYFGCVLVPAVQDDGGALSRAK
jgi:hypothetical protein